MTTLERFELQAGLAIADGGAFARDVRGGLSQRPYRLMPRYFYDDVGSALFEAITRLPEYYVSRTERDLLRSHAKEIVANVTGPIEILDLGCGNAEKTTIVVEAVLRQQDTLRFHAVDVSADALVSAARVLIASHDRLLVQAYLGDYTALMRAGGLDFNNRILAVMLGTSIGNYNPAERGDLLELMHATLASGDGLLLGYDLKKDRATLELAYNDPTGVTAAFNRNILARINRELGGTFDVSAFSYFAKYDEETGAVESFVRAERSMGVNIPGAGISVDVRAGETIHTESSYKFTVAEMSALLSKHGFISVRTYCDDQRRYALSLFTRT